MFSNQKFFMLVSMRILILFVSFFTSNNLLAQSNDLQVISTSGLSLTN